MINVYEYIAETNPYVVRSLLSKYGHGMENVRSKKDLGVILRQLVVMEGKPAFVDVMQNHPDREVILELFGNQKPGELYAHADGGSEKPCGCKKCNHNTDNHYRNADGATAMAMLHSTSMTNIAIIAGALILAAAIISKTGK